MRRLWSGLPVLLAAAGLALPAVAQERSSGEAPPSLEYRPKRPVLPEPKEPMPAPPVTIFRKAFGGYGIGTGSFSGPVDVASDRDGNIYVLDTGNNRVQKFDSFLKFVLAWGATGTRAGEFKRPQAITVDRGGFVYVVDTGNNRIQKFDGQGRHLLSWGSQGSRTGDFKAPLDISLDDRGNIYVLDAENQRVQKFDAGAQFISQWGLSFGDRRGDYDGLVSLAWTDDRFGYIYLLGRGCVVQQFELDGTLVSKWSAAAPGAGLCVPGRLEIDEKNDYVYVLDSGNGLLARFKRDGQFLAALRGAERTFSGPRGFGVYPDREEVLVADTENNLVQKFTLR